MDWWTLGVLIHELMSGHAPFEANGVELFDFAVAAGEVLGQDVIISDSALFLSR